MEIATVEYRLVYGSSFLREGFYKFDDQKNMSSGYTNN